jgi:hypothetical protein
MSSAQVAREDWFSLILEVFESWIIKGYRIACAGASINVQELLCLNAINGGAPSIMECAPHYQIMLIKDGRPLIRSCASCCYDCQAWPVHVQHTQTFILMESQAQIIFLLHCKWKINQLKFCRVPTRIIRVSKVAVLKPAITHLHGFFPRRSWWLEKKSDEHGFYLYEVVLSTKILTCRYSCCVDSQWLAFLQKLVYLCLNKWEIKSS